MSFAPVSVSRYMPCFESGSEDTFNVNETVATIAKIAIGIAAAIFLLPYLSLAHTKIIEVLTGWKCDVSADQDVFAIWKGFDSLPTAILRGAVKAAMLSYIVIFGPLLEEFIFRSGLQSWMKSWVENPDNVLNQVSRIVGNGLVFGAAHLSPFQGWYNVPVFCITALMGCMYALLTEATGDITASSTAHMTHNGIAMHSFLTGRV